MCAHTSSDYFLKDMALPMNRHSSSRRDRRRAHHALSKINISLCPKCKSPSLPHVACKNCGTYNKREVIDVLAKLDKKEKKKKEKEIKEGHNK